jgi:hypothetical protein
VGEVVAAVASYTNGLNLNEPQVAVYSYPATATPKSPPTIRDFSDRGQQVLIEKLTRTGANPEAIRAVLAKPIAAAQGAAEPITPKQDLYEFDRNIVATVTKGFAVKPGDRLMWTWIMVRPANFEFKNYSIAATKHQILDIAHIEHKTTTELRGEISATVPGPGAIAPSLSGGIQHERSSSADIRQQFEELSIDIEPGLLRIYRESERNLDAAGNTLIKATLVSDPDRLEFGPQLDPDKRIDLTARSLRVVNLEISKNGALLVPSDATMDVEFVKTPLRCPLRAFVRMVYQIRRIKPGGHRHYVEGDQKVSIEQHTTGWREVTLVSADEVAPAAFGLVDGSGRITLAKVPDGASLPLTFRDFETAQAVANWINVKRPSVIGKSQLRLSYGDSLRARRLVGQETPERCRALVYRG